MNERELIERWRQHYYDHLNGTQTGDQNDAEEDLTGAISNNDDVYVMMSEVKEAINQLKNHEAADKDGITAKLYAVCAPVDS